MKKSFENVLSQIMQNPVYTQKMIISAYIKILQIKLLPLSAAKEFTLRKRTTPIKCSVLPIDNYACSSSNGGATP